MASTLPDVLVGAWHRRSVQLAGGEAAEHALVLWLQAPDAFADVRIPWPGATGPFATLEAFAGSTEFFPATSELAWHHEVDRTGTFAGMDRATVAWPEPDTMVETGSIDVAGAPATYTEVWAKVAAGPVHARRWTGATGTGVQVEIGPLSLVVDADADGVVTAALSVGDAVVARVDAAGGAVLDPPALDAALGGGVPADGVVQP